MTRTIQRHDSAQDVGSSMPAENISSNLTQHSSIQLSADSASDNEASEKPVREKLKKTSIASIPRNNLANSRIDARSELDNTPIQAEPATTSGEHSALTSEVVENINGSRGRSLRKRSFEDLENGEGGSADSKVPLDRMFNSHARKRSRDMRSDEFFETESQSKAPSEIPEQEEKKRNKNMDEMNEPDDTYLMGTIQNVAPISDPESADLEMRDSVLSPRKKRSRDRLDPDTDREQKIVATEEAKAQRRSEENERDDSLLDIGNAASQQKNSTRIRQPSRSDEMSGGADNDLSINSVTT